MRILLVEDNIRLSELIKQALEKDGFAVDPVLNAFDAGEHLQSYQYGLVLLDLSLPDGNGLDLIAIITTLTPAPPILVITARGGLDERVKGLNMGADDYLVKPFESAELVARCRALLRRPGSVLGSVLKAGNVSFDTGGRNVFVKDKRKQLPPKEMALLEHLMRHFNSVISREALETNLYSSGQDVSPNALEASVSRLRRWLKDHDADLTLHTSHGVGYILTESGTGHK